MGEGAGLALEAGVEGGVCGGGVGGVGREFLEDRGDEDAVGEDVGVAVTKKTSWSCSTALEGGPMSRR